RLNVTCTPHAACVVRGFVSTAPALDDRVPILSTSLEKPLSTLSFAVSAAGFSVVAAWPSLVVSDVFPPPVVSVMLCLLELPQRARARRNTTASPHRSARFGPPTICAQLVVAPDPALHIPPPWEPPLVVLSDQ